MTQNAIDVALQICFHRQSFYVKAEFMLQYMLSVA
jgi:hypothetical protein